MSDHLATYLNDHLAGSVAALDMLDHLIAADSTYAGELGDLRREIGEERAVLESVIARVGATPGGVRQAVAWVAEKLARLKLRADDPAGGPLKLFEGVEAVAVGIHGKESLWRALAAVAPATPALAGPDYAALVARSQGQRERIEAVRLAAARAAFGGAG